jgi:hypothetical protein
MADPGRCVCTRCDRCCLWLSGERFRAIERLVSMDRKTVRRYVGVAERLGSSATATRSS